MQKRKQLEDAHQTIEEFFNSSTRKAYTETNLIRIINEVKTSWGLSKNKSPRVIINYLLEKSKLSISLFFNDASKDLEGTIVYSWDTKDEFTIIAALNTGAYFTHYSSLLIHQLTLQIPKVYYLNYEHAKSSTTYGKLSQQAIDNAFSKPQRKSEQRLTLDDKRVYLINGRYTGRLGVITESSSGKYYHFTDVERTLIDIAVRPAYAGGVFEVIDAYSNAKNLVDIRKLKDYLDKINFIYPYNQVIGFYLDAAGYDGSISEIFLKSHKFKFYLTYDIRSKEYSSKWNLYYPRGISL